MQGGGAIASGSLPKSPYQQHDKQWLVKATSGKIDLSQTMSIQCSPCRFRDKVLSKPSPVLTTPMFDDDESEAAALSEFFSVTLPDDTTVRYRQDLAGKFGSQFLCTDWAFARITGTVVDGEPFGVKVPEGTTDYTAATMETELNGMGLIACTEDDDSDRVSCSIGLSS
jgi:hypothetical protein